MISIVIPTLNESKTIAETLTKLLEVTPHDYEVIVIDGFSDDNTNEIVKTFDRVKLLKHKRGRANQMNYGAKIATKDHIIFLHADTFISLACLEKLSHEIKSTEVKWGWFPITLNHPRFIYRLIEICANVRAKFTGTPLGDHAIFVRKDIFEKVGGFPEIPLMEDLGFVEKLKDVSKGVMIKSSVCTSTRRFNDSGIFLTLVKMWILRILYYVGFSTKKLSRYYNDVR